MGPSRAADNFRQRQKITTAIRSICEYYPPNTCLRELLQNADDAGATEIEYVLDTRTYTDKPLLAEGLDAYSGPALLARNDSVFRDEYFNSLSTVGDSVKKYDPASTGKFGQGFNAVYHWTDGPWIFSREWLLILDPHERWSKETGQPGGPRWDVVENHDCAEIQNHLKMVDRFNLDQRESLSQTIIRIPLRTSTQAATSDLFKAHADIKDIETALREFGQEMKEGGLLFLKHIRKVTIRIDNTIMLKVEMLEANTADTKTRKQLPSDFKDLYASHSAHNVADHFPVFEMSMRYTEHDISRSFGFVVQHAMLRSTGDSDMDMWGRERKLFPWVAIAAPLKNRYDDKLSLGRLFTVLRLPMPANLPVHVHGLFSISPDRGRLSFTRGADDPPTKWNRFIFSHCVALAWIKLLIYRNAVSWREEEFAFWPRPSFKSAETGEMWDSLDDDVIDKAIDGRHEIWNAVDGRCVDMNTAFFAIKDGDVSKYSKALAQVNVPAVYLSEPLSRKVQQRAKAQGWEMSGLEPTSIRRFLRRREPSSLLPDDFASLLLEFCLLDAIRGLSKDAMRTKVCKEIQRIRLWPLVDGTRAAFGSEPLLLPRDEVELELFAKSRPACTLDITQLSPKVRILLLKDRPFPSDLVRFRGLLDLKIDWPTMYPLAFSTKQHSEAPVARLPKHGNVITSIWKWISNRIQEGYKMDPRLLGHLLLIPITETRIRPYASSSENPPVLLIEPQELLYSLLTNAISRDQLAAPPLLDFKVLPATAVDLLRNNEQVRTDTRCTSIDHAETFVDWLVAGKSMLPMLPIEDRKLLLSHLENTTRREKLPRGLPYALKSKLRELPIYHKLACRPPFKERSHVTCDLVCGGKLYETPIDIPSLPDLLGITFISPQSLAETALIGRLEALEKADPKFLLDRHLLTWLESIPPHSNDDDLGPVKEKLVNWIFDKAPANSSTWMNDVFSRSIIPLPRRTGERQYRSLPGMVDPSSSLANLYDDAEQVFPCLEFFSRNKVVLKSYGLVSLPLWDTPLDRIRHYSKRGLETDPGKIESLLETILQPRLLDSEDAVKEIRSLRWLPGTCVTGEPVILAPNECRSGEESHLVDHVLGTITFSTGSLWRKLLGWHERVPAKILLKQLDICLLRNDHIKAGKVLHQMDPEHCPELNNKHWILGRSGEYFTAEKVFQAAPAGTALRSWPLAPFLDEVDRNFAREHARLLGSLQPQPPVENLLKIQRSLAEGTQAPLDASNLTIAVNILEVAMYLGYDSAELLVPDTTSRLRSLTDIVHGDPLATGDILDFHFTHPAISASLALRLHIENSQERALQLDLNVDNEDDDNYTPSESLLNIISDTLDRYPIAAAFNEFLANADDARATKITWILDKCDYGIHASASLLTPELKSFQGPSLMVHNDGVFSEKDFAGFKDIGQGSKQEDSHSTGMFGRGVLSMYHFTDVPMLVSANSLLILNPQQRLLPINPKNHPKRKVGTKLPLSRVSHRVPDQLSPFVGLYGFEPFLENFNGTIFRFPLRANGSQGSRKENFKQIDQAQVELLLRGYYTTARTALLFLRHVECIEFRVRGEHDPRWSVSAKRTRSPDSETFQDVEIKSTQMSIQGQRVDTWCVGLKEINEIPADITRSGKGLGKSLECGIAACLKTAVLAKKDANTKPENGGFKIQPQAIATNGAAKQPAVQHKVFCRLPTNHDSSLPVSFHASFTVTGDRRNVTMESGTENGNWNRWLLSSCVSALYVDAVRYLAPRLGQKVFNVWPPQGVFSSLDTVSGVLRDAFWDKIAKQGHEYNDLLPLLKQTEKQIGLETTQMTTCLTDARFDTLSHNASQLLRPLLLHTFPLLVRPPQTLRGAFGKLAAGKVTGKLDPDCLTKAFKIEQNCKFLETYIRDLDREEDRREAMAFLLRAMIPKTSVEDMTALNILDGCRIVPRPQLTLPLGTLKINAPRSTFQNLIATAEEQELFDFAIDTMVNDRLFPVPSSGSQNADIAYSDPIQTFESGAFNVRRIEISDLGGLLATSNSPTTALNHKVLEKWLLRFWLYFDFKIRAARSHEDASALILTNDVDTLLSGCNIHHQPIYRARKGQEWRYLTPQQFKEEPCVIQPPDKEQSNLCVQVPSLQIIDKSCLPFLLREDEHSLLNTTSFGCFLRALKTLGKNTGKPLQSLLGEKLTCQSRDLLRTLVLRYVNSTNSGEHILRKLPIWPRLEHSSTSPKEHVAAEDAKFCSHEPMLRSWAPNLSSFVKPKIVEAHASELAQLGINVLTREEVWHLIKDYLPRVVVPKESRQDLVKLLQYLKQDNVRPSGKIAPNGASVMCEPQTLYDHQDDILSAAFREEKNKRFLHADVQIQELHSLWIFLGLRARPPTRLMSSDLFLECVTALERRWNSPHVDSAFSEDAKKVTSYLYHNNDEFQHWTAATWAKIADVPMFRVRDVPVNEPLYRSSRMRLIAEEQDKGHRALSDAGKVGYKEITWSQNAFLQIPPGEFVYDTLPNRGKPAASRVFEHLKFLATYIPTVDREVPDYLRDLQACYAYLQAEVEATRAIPGVRQAEVWLNINTTPIELVLRDHLQSSFTRATRLCLNSPVDSGPLKVARKFLIPYEKLLVALDCPTVKHPPSTSPPQSSDSRELSLVAAFAELRILRDRNELVDVTLSAENQHKPAHKIILACVSEYCKKQFSGAWGPFLAHNATIYLEDLTFLTLSQMVDFAYTGEISYPELQNQEDNEELEGNLSMLLDLLKGTDMWCLDRLHTMTENFLTSEPYAETYIRPDTVDEVLERAEEARAQKLVEYCREFLKDNERVVEYIREEAARDEERV